MRPIALRCCRISAQLALLAPALALGWEPAGHAYTGAVADWLLTKNAAANVKKIAGVPLATASLWADCVKDVEPAVKGKFTYTPHPVYHAPCVPFETKAGIARMEDYVRRNWAACKKEASEEPCHKQYHYTDIAVQRSKYDRAYHGTSEHDIVGALDAAVLVLQGKPAPAPFSIKDKREALLLIAHFVGDLHQPLHVGGVYLDAKGKRIDPDVPGKHPGKGAETRGGNSISVGGANLHSLWDRIPDGLDPAKIAGDVLERAKAIPKTKGPMSAWPAAWASDAMQVSHSAFAAVTFGPKKDNRWEARFPKGKDKYDDAREKLQREQLAKGGARLAQLLNEIWP